MQKNNALPAKPEQSDGDEQAKLNRKKDNFISVASHELRTPLGIIRGYAQLTANRLENKIQVLTKMATANPECITTLNWLDTDRDLVQLKAIINNVDKINTLLNELLDVSMLEISESPITMQPFSLEKLVEKVILRYDSYSNIHKLILNMSNRFLDKTQTLIFGDPQKIDRVISNLITNAIKYSPQGGIVEIKIKYEINGVLVQVSDEGIGIPADEQKDIFDCYYRAKNAYQSEIGGLGVKLYLCKHIVNQHNGSIWVESRLNQGSTFMLWLPHIHQNEKPAT